MRELHTVNNFYTCSVSRRYSRRIGLKLIQGDYYYWCAYAMFSIYDGCPAISQITAALTALKIGFATVRH